MRALAILHDALSETGFIGERAVERGFDVDELTICSGPDDPSSDVGFPDPTAYDAVLSFGAVWSVYDREAIGSWIDRELDMIRRAHDAGVPVLGICFGGQALAAALGGTVTAAPTMEVGWYDIDSEVPDDVAVGPWLQWHGDRFLVPPAARELARGGVGSQAFVTRRSLGVQFHPEATVDVVHFWVEYGADTLASLGIDPAALRDETRRNAPIARANAHRLFDYFIDDVARR